MSGKTIRKSKAFSLIELVIVIVIIAIIAAIAIPRMSRGAQGAADSALTGNLRVIRSALDLYATEHGGAYPPTNRVAEHLTQYTNETGSTFGPTKDTATGVYLGPYLRAIPPLPVNCPDKGSNAIAPAAAAGVGWVYTINAAGVGEIKPNTTTESDAKGTPYINY
jgi:general secretion pathway protein G